MDEANICEAGLKMSVTVPVSVEWAPGMPQMLLSAVPYAPDPCDLPCLRWFAACLYAAPAAKAKHQLLPATAERVMLARAMRAAR
jgi:hypothetical protein